MTPDSPEFWAQSAQEFQETLKEGWAKAFQSFQNMDLGASGANLAAPTVKPPQISFAPEKLQELQIKKSNIKHTMILQSTALAQMP